MGVTKWLGLSKKKDKEQNGLSKEQMTEISSEEDDHVQKQEQLEEDFYPGYLEVSADQLVGLIQQYCPYKYSTLVDTRSSIAYRKGGTACQDPRIVKKYRSVAKEVIKQVGKKLISGHFNLTTIGFPIRAMISKSNLESAVGGTATFPVLLGKAVQTNDPLLRFRLVVVAVLSSFYFTNQFQKPLNPILGETLQAHYVDGTKVYAEQISHHPPISYFLVYGPNDSYVYSGYYDISVKAGLNSMAINNKGKRIIKFKDGQTIIFGFPQDVFKGTFFGTTRLESLGNLSFNDQGNKISTEIKFGGCKGRPSDYFEGKLMQNGQHVETFHGTYLGYIDCEQTRYWQYDTAIMPLRIAMLKEQLPSDHLYRQDLQKLRKGDMEGAQMEKDRLEAVQRQDASLRKQKRRS